MRARTSVVLATLLVAGPPLLAQNTPEAAATAFGTAIATADWAGAARVMHPGALKQLRDLFSLALFNEKLGQAREQLFGFKTTAEASSAPDTVVFAAFIKSLISHQAGLAEALRTASFTPVGHIKVGGDTVLVVTRMRFNAAGGAAITQFDVMPFLRDGQIWKGLLKTDFTNMAAMLKTLVAPVGG